MEKIQFDSGIRTYRINGSATMRFNPADPNLYARFLETGEKMREIEKTLQEKAKTLKGDDGRGALSLMTEADGEMKKLLTFVFGDGNDFTEIFRGVNLLAVAENGERVITNFLQAIQPVLTAGAERCTREKEKEAVEKAKRRRGSQC